MKLKSATAEAAAQKAQTSIVAKQIVSRICTYLPRGNLHFYQIHRDKHAEKAL